MSNDCAAATAALTTMRQILIALRDKGILSSNDIVNAINKGEDGMANHPDWNESLRNAYLWLKEPHLLESVMQTAEELEKINNLRKHQD